MRKTMLAVLFLHLILAVEAHLYSSNLWIFHNLMRNYSHVGNGYDIFSIVVAGLIFVISAFLHN